MLGPAISWLGGSATSLQVLLALPMTLDLLGKSGPPSFLLLSLLLTAYHSVLSTIRLTPFAPFASLLTFFSPAITSGLIALTFYYYLNPPPASSSLFSPSHWLVNICPYIYASLLRWSTPLFTLLEGISTLLVIQVAGRLGKGWTEDDDYEGPRWRSILSALGAVGVYALAGWGLHQTFPYATEEAIPAFILGCALTAVLFLSMIGFALRRTNILETSLVFLYVVVCLLASPSLWLLADHKYSAWLARVESVAKPRSFGSGWLPTLNPSIPKWLQAKTLPALTFPTVTSLAMGALSRTTDSVRGVLTTLPTYRLVSLVFRLSILGIAGRILPALRKNAIEEDPFEDDEQPAMRLSTFLLSYRQTILIAAYTHLLLLDGGQIWWRWGSVALFLAVWSLELMLEADDEDGPRLKID